MTVDPFASDVPVIGAESNDFVGAPPRRRGPIIAVAAFVGITVLGLGSFLFIRSLFGSPFGAAEAMPAATDVYIGIDLLQFRDTSSIDNLVAAWTEPMGDAGLIDPQTGSFLDLIGSDIERQTGISIEDDVVPWLGRSAGIGIDGIEFAVEQVPTVYVSIDVRDRAKAQAFLDKVVDLILEENPAISPASSEYQSVSITSIEGDEPDSTIAFGLTDDHLIVASGYGALTQALDATRGDNLAGNEMFGSAMAELPEDRAIAVYVSGRSMRNAVESQAEELLLAGSQMESVLDALRAIEAFAGSMTIFDDGVRFDAAVFGDLGATLEPVPVALPAETAGYISYPIEGRATIEALQGDEATRDIVDSLLFELDLGFDPIEDILGNMTGRVAMTALPTNRGLFTTETGIPIGFTLSWGLIDEGVMEHVESRAKELAADGPFEFVDQGVTTVLVDGEPAFSYEIRDNQFVIGTAGDIVESVATPSSDVMANPLHDEIDRLAPGDGLMMFVDVQSILGTIEADEQTMAVVGPIRAIGVGMEQTESLARTAFVVLVNTP